MNCTPKIGHNFWRCSFLCQNTQKKLKKKQLAFLKKLSPFRIAKGLETPKSTVKNRLYKFKLSHNLTHKIGNEYFQQILNVKFLKRGGKISYPLNEKKEVQKIDSLVDSDSPKDQAIQMVKSIMSIKSR